MSKLAIGDLAPDFALGTQHAEKNISSKDLLGKNCILYFYPKDNTSFCSIEATAFNELKEEFTKLNTIILGVSRDSTASHKKFADAKCLEFDLLADIDGDLCKKYDVLVEKSMFGKKYFGINRSTYLIDSHGKIAAIWPKVIVSSHAKEVLEACQQLYNSTL